MADDYTLTTEQALGDEIARVRHGQDVTASDLANRLMRWLTEHDAKVRAEAVREYVTAARENPHTQYWPASGVLDDAEQWADEIEKGTI